MDAYRSVVSLRVLGSGSIVVMLACAVLASAQTTLDYPVGQFMTYRADSGSFDNPADDYKIVYSKVVQIENAAWLRLYFGEFHLDKDSFVRTTSLYDGEIQELDFAEATMWNFTTAYFNGDEVLVELIAAPHSRQNRVVIERLGVDWLPVEADRGPCANDDCGICHPDSRVLSSEMWAGRLWPVGCTGSVYNPAGCIVSAGHCVGANQVIQFNVPSSTSNCTPRVPPVADQFPITGWLHRNSGVGADWAVMTSGTNNLGQTIYQRYGEFRPIATTTGLPGNPIDVWGYGASNAYPTRNHVQQYSAGSISARYSTYYRAVVDITYGNSGSALMRNNEIIGIVTHCPGHGQCNNYMTRIDVSAFVNARNQLCPDEYGACCFADGTCEIRTEAHCLTVGGTWLGVGTVCTPNPCPQPQGACCFANGACDELTQADCVAADGDWQGMGTGCTPNPCVTLGDMNCDGRVDFADINPFVQLLADPAGWQATYPDCPMLNGDINGDGVVNFADINPFVELLASQLLANR